MDWYNVEGSRGVNMARVDNGCSNKMLQATMVDNGLHFSGKALWGIGQDVKLR